MSAWPSLPPSNWSSPTANPAPNQIHSSARPPRPSQPKKQLHPSPHPTHTPTSTYGNKDTTQSYALSSESPLSSNPPSPTLSSSGSESVDANRRSDESTNNSYLQTQHPTQPPHQTQTHTQQPYQTQPYYSGNPNPNYPTQTNVGWGDNTRNSSHHHHHPSTTTPSHQPTFHQQAHAQYHQQQQNVNTAHAYHPHPHHQVHPQHPYHNQTGHSFPHNGNSPNFMVTPTRPKAPPNPTRPTPQHNTQPQLHPHLHRPPTPNPSNPPSASSSLSGTTLRANSDQLKTYLRKKACLYEPTTSHAIAYVTWHVGKNLSSTTGHFTRQQLQVRNSEERSDELRMR
ncbi:hypothetical protein TL16_g05245 [Triparma laevis f. inornata]|uniref:Uncharacterized protein n=1 Tax=Triparma laevis f. inornata TaxID=1714386 RepID=A0A9W7AII1_9STRA|nr:hypothetical protein TL16_g05245 [Triparma laevis f. inornata]